MKIHLPIVIICLIFCTISQAQNIKQRNSVNSSILPMERKISTTFANGLKEYYAQNYADAEKTFLAIIGENPNHAPSFYYLGKLKSEERDLLAATHYLQKAIKIDPKNIWYNIALAQVLDASGNYMESSQIWKKVSSLKSDNEYYMFLYAESCLRLGKYQEVIKTYDKMEKLVGYDEDLTAAKVELWLYLNDIKNAVNEYDKLIKVNPQQEQYYLKAANIYVINGAPEKALPYFEKVRQLNPNNAEVHFSLANYYDKVGDKEQAFKEWKSVFSSSDIDFERKRMVFNRYMLPLPTGIVSSEQYELAYAITVAHPENAHGWAAMGELKFRDKQYKDAADYLEKAIRIDPSHYAVWRSYLYSLGQLEEVEKIVSYESELLELFPIEPYVYMVIGSAYLDLEQANKAIALFEKALKYVFNKAERAQIYSAMAIAYEQLGESEKAQEYRQKAQ